MREQAGGSFEAWESGSRHGAVAEGPRRPLDLVVIMTDQQRSDQIGYASGRHFETPTLDALAERGVIFDGAYSASTTCVPARGSLLTGLLPHRFPTQENGAALREDFWTVAHALRGAGYETALIGKMHFAPVHARHGFDTMRLCEHLKWQGLGPLSKQRNDEVDGYHTWLLEHGLPDWRLTGDGPMPDHYPPGAHPTAWIEREVTSFLRTRRGDRPLFLVISFPHPHAPYDPREPYASMYDPADSILPPAGYEVNGQLPIGFALATEQSKTRPEAADPERVRSFLATVRGLVREIDDTVGRLVARMDLDETVIVFTSDHGDFSGYRGLMRKDPWIPFDDLVRVPFFVTGAGIAGGQRVPDLVQSCDLVLTCLDYAAVEPPAGVTFDARTLRPIIDGRPGPGDLDRTIISATGWGGWPMIRRGRYKYIELAEHGENQCVLFDLQEDPLERVNLASSSCHRDVYEELVSSLRAATSEPVLDLPISRKVAQPA